MKMRNTVGERWTLNLLGIIFIFAIRKFAVQILSVFARFKLRDLVISKNKKTNKTPKFQYPALNPRPSIPFSPS